MHTTLSPRRAAAHRIAHAIVFAAFVYKAIQLHFFGEITTYEWTDGVVTFTRTENPIGVYFCLFIASISLMFVLTPNRPQE